ncbi:hypothetical protein L227DRAFT_326226 [Lentinus tigrinus ALCF2SS1-6]|uniref:F-box domain-containing protein n=1 Tax=Lentinus tigrinus ALCF2SS1-6 TaxID=1328759 RepID=A0A5C2SKG0_9APHY|nr:hypothetical protein L227DRAFT_326226 [Lentinus tigrinus ALCF2SS1-6]
MQNCCLPIELCELIMDLVVEPFPRWKRFHWSTDCRPGNVVHCARVCSAWLPRARCVLYSSVLFKNPSQVQHFINSITESPLLADMVRELVIKPEDDNTYIPFVHERLLGRLRYLRTLVYDFARGRAWVYPPHHHLLIARFPLTELAIRYPCRDANPAMWFETFRLICSLHHLHTLHLYIGTSPGLSDADIVRLDTIRRLPACAKIETLVIEGANFYEFLPKGAFGTSVRQLTLRFYSGPILTSGEYHSLSCPGEHSWRFGYEAHGYHKSLPFHRFKSYT